MSTDRILVTSTTNVFTGAAGMGTITPVAPTTTVDPNGDDNGTIVVQPPTTTEERPAEGGGRPAEIYLSVAIPGLLGKLAVWTFLFF